MVRLILTLSCLFFLFTAASAQEVPDAVTKAFQKKYPDAKSVNWASEEDGFEATFQLKSKKMDAEFDAKGNWLETDTKIKVKDLPKAVSKAIAKEFPGYEIEEVEMISSPQLDEAYEVELELETDDKELEIEVVFSSKGKILKKQKEEDDDEDDDDDDDDDEDE
jgi:hypothetical protein